MARGGSKGTGGGSGSGGSSGGNGKVLTPDDTGYIMDADTGIMGAWYLYADDLGSNGKPPGDCQAKGMHMDSECSTIMYAATATLSGDGFPQDTPGKMCIKGTAAKVITMGASMDYSNIFGIGMGLDFNNSGSAKMPFDLTAKKITAFKFTLSGVPMGGLRVEFPTTETEAAGHDSYYAIEGDQGRGLHRQHGGRFGDDDRAGEPRPCALRSPSPVHHAAGLQSGPRHGPPGSRGDQRHECDRRLEPLHLEPDRGRQPVSRHTTVRSKRAPPHRRGPFALSASMRFE